MAHKNETSGTSTWCSAAYMIKLMQRNIREKHILKKRERSADDADDDQTLEVRLLSRRMRELSMYDGDSKKARKGSKESGGGSLMPPPPTFDPEHSDIDAFNGFMCYQCYSDGLPCPMRIVHMCTECDFHYCRRHLAMASHDICACNVAAGK